MLIFRVILLAGGPGRIGLHTLIFKTHIIFLIWCTAAASLHTLFLLRVRHLASVQSVVRVAHAHYLPVRM